MNSESKSVLFFYFNNIIKSNKLIRILAFPYMFIKERKMKKDFINSEDYEFIKSLYSKFEGKRCFIIGNGPSLAIRDLDLIKNEYSFAANRILSLLDKTQWRPTFYLCPDKETYISVESELIKADIEYKFVRSNCIIPDNTNIRHFFINKPFRVNPRNLLTEVSSDAAEGVNPGGTVTFASIQMAVYMGFKEIYLLGVDHNYAVKVDISGKITTDNSIQTYANGLPDWGHSIQNIDVTTKAYECAKKYCDEHGIKIYNATRGGKLEVFERADFDSLFSDKTQEVQ